MNDKIDYNKILKKIKKQESEDIFKDVIDSSEYRIENQVIGKRKAQISIFINYVEEDFNIIWKGVKETSKEKKE